MSNCRRLAVVKPVTTKVEFRYPAEFVFPQTGSCSIEGFPGAQFQVSACAFQLRSMPQPFPVLGFVGRPYEYGILLKLVLQFKWWQKVRQQSCQRTVAIEGNALVAIHLWTEDEPNVMLAGEKCDDIRHRGVHESHATVLIQHLV
jgi:hypothetical protein